jgi:hypothetical protein
VDTLLEIFRMCLRVQLISVRSGGVVECRGEPGTMLFSTLAV